MTESDIKKLQRYKAAEIKKFNRQVRRSKGLNTRGRLLGKWRVLEMGDEEETWKKKLSFIPVVEIKKFGRNNLRRLQKLQDRLVEVVRLRGGARTATKSKTHQKGQSLGMTVAPGGRRPVNPLERSQIGYSGTVQTVRFKDDGMAELQREATTVITACIEEAFGSSKWYNAVKQAFAKISVYRRLRNTTLPASNIWWNWKANKSTAHIDINTVGPCFVLTPYTYNGAELLCDKDNIKIPMVAGKIVGGLWQRYPHCNDQLLDDERYSFVVYFDVAMLRETYWVRY